MVPAHYMFCQSHQLICYSGKGCSKLLALVQQLSYKYYVYKDLTVCEALSSLCFLYLIEFLLTIATSGTVPEIDENSFVMNSVSFI